MLFAIDAAQKLGEQGENTQVDSMGDAVLKRTATRRPCLRPGQRLLWVVLSRWWADWQRSLVLVQPATVLRWRRRGLWLVWGFISHNPTYNGLRVSQKCPTRPWEPSSTKDPTNREARPLDSCHPSCLT